MYAIREITEQKKQYRLRMRPLIYFCIDGYSLEDNVCVLCVDVKNEEEETIRVVDTKRTFSVEAGSPFILSCFVVDSGAADNQERVHYDINLLSAEKTEININRAFMCIYDRFVFDALAVKVL